MRFFPVLLTLLLIVTLPSCKYFKGKRLFGKKADTMAVWHARQDSLRKADSLKTIVLQAKENDRLDSIKSAEEKTALENKLRYHIIVGSFLHPDYATRLADTYHQKGYETRILKAPGSRFQYVSAEASDNFRKAFSRLKYFQGNVEVDAWIYVKK